MTVQASSAATHRRPNTGSALGYLLLGFPLGITWFVLLTTLFAVGIGTSIVWAGIPVTVAALLLTRGVGRLERARANAMLRTTIADPYRGLPRGLRPSLLARFRDRATWRDLGYALALLPVGTFEFVVLVAVWAPGLNLVAVPFYYWALPDGVWTFPTIGDGPHWFTVDSFSSGLPWLVAGLLLCALGVLLTRALARWHARFATRALGRSGKIGRTEGDH